MVRHTFKIFHSILQDFFLSVPEHFEKLYIKGLIKDPETYFRQSIQEWTK